MANQPRWLTVAPVTRSPAPFSAGNRLAGDGGLVDRGRALANDAVDRYGLAGTNHHKVSHAHLVGGHLDLLAVAAHARRLGREVHERADGRGRLALGASLEVLAQRDEHKDGTGRVKVQ
jgi:hypothetical protein